MNESARSRQQVVKRKSLNRTLSQKVLKELLSIQQIIDVVNGYGQKHVGDFTSRLRRTRNLSNDSSRIIQQIYKWKLTTCSRHNKNIQIN